MDDPHESNLKIEADGAARLVALLDEAMALAQELASTPPEALQTRHESFDGDEHRAIVARFFSPC